MTSASGGVHIMWRNFVDRIGVEIKSVGVTFRSGVTNLKFRTFKTLEWDLRCSTVIVCLWIRYYCSGGWFVCGLPDDYGDI